MRAFRTGVPAMQTRLTATSLRRNLSSTLDHVVATGEPVEIERPGGAVRIVRETSARRLAALKPHPGVVNGNAAELVLVSWEQDWKPTL